MTDATPGQRARRADVDPAVLRELVEYDPMTGKFRWKERPARFFKKPSHRAMWNKQHAGREAFCVRDQDGRLRGTIFRQQYLSHRVAWAMTYGEWPQFEIDHINGDNSDNRIANLRDVDGATNKMNLRPQRGSFSGHPGVYFMKGDRRWKPWVTVINVPGGPRKFLGCYRTREEAIEVRRAAQADLGYHPNHGLHVARKGNGNG